MKIVLLSVAMATGLANSNISFSQEVDPNLAEACYGDIDLTEYVVQASSLEGATATEVLSAVEIDQIQTILDDETLSEVSISDKLEAVMKACSEGRILLQRFSSALSAG